MRSSRNRWPTLWWCLAPRYVRLLPPKSPGNTLALPRFAGLRGFALCYDSTLAGERGQREGAGHCCGQQLSEWRHLSPHGPGRPWLRRRCGGPEFQGHEASPFPALFVEGGRRGRGETGAVCWEVSERGADALLSACRPRPLVPCVNPQTRWRQEANDAGGEA